MSERFNRDDHKSELYRFFQVDRMLGMLALDTMKLANEDFDGDGLAVYMGLGEEQRLDTAIEEWNANPDLRHFLIANAKQIEATALNKWQIMHRIADSGGRLSGVSVLEDPAHTKIQADWLSAQALERHLSAVKLVVPSYHSPRAYATTVASLHKEGYTSDMPLTVALPTYPVGYVTPEPVYEGMAQTFPNMAGQEASKIRKYQPGGDVAPDAMWREHIDLSAK